MRLIAILVLALAAAQGLIMLLAPQRFAAFELWKYRLIGARPAEPGRATFLLYRLGGAATCVAAALLLIKFVSE